MMKTQNIFMLSAIMLILFACESEFESSIEDNEVYRTGDADFSNYVSLGNSLTAGFADNALYIEGQENSYPNILAQQFALVGGGEFTQPLVNDNVGGLLLNGNPLPGFGPRLVLASQGENAFPAPLDGTITTDISNVVQGPINNLGVPGAKSFHLGFNGYGNINNLPASANPYFVRFASSPNASIIEDAAAQAPSFFSLWIGNNDVLGFATSGGTGQDQTGNLDPTTYASNDITDPNVFAGALTGYVEALTSTASGGVLYNIPDVTTIPFFTTVPHNPLNPASPDLAAQIPLLNQVYGALNQIFVALGQPERVIQFSTTEANPLVIQDESLANLSTQITTILAPNPEFIALVQSFGLPAQAAPLVAGLLGETYGQARQATPQDLIPLTSSSVIGQLDTDRASALVAQGLPPELAAQFSVNGITLPMADPNVLTTNEQMMINNARMAYNSTLESLAANFGLAYVDINQVLLDSQNGIPFDGGVLTSDFVSGGAFSLDGVHLTPRGYALVANETIKAINQTYGSNLPMVNLGDYKTISTSDNAL
jgi:hypothetical protein